MAIRWDELEGASFGAYLYSIEDDAERLEVLYRECYEEIRAQCRKALAQAGNFSDAEDAAQEAVIRAAAAVRGTYKPGMPFRPWLTKLTGNVCRDLGRAQRRTTNVTMRCAERGYGVDLSTPAPESDGPEETMFRRMKTETILEMLMSLSDAERRALWLQNEGLSYEEIGELEGWSHPSVRSRIHRAKQNFRRRLAALGGLEELGLSGVLGAGVGVLRRLRDRSRAWVLRNSPRGSNLAAEGGALNVAIVARATEVVAAGFVALGALALPHGGGAVASGLPQFLTAMPVSAVHAAVTEGTSATPHAVSTAGAAQHRLADRSSARVTAVTVGSPDGSGAKETVKVSKTDRSIVIGESLNGPLPVIGDDYSSSGRSEFECYGLSGQVVCDTYDHLPPSP